VQAVGRGRGERFRLPIGDPRTALAATVAYARALAMNAAINVRMAVTIKPRHCRQHACGELAYHDDPFRA
jgi:hypothetical protein